MFNRNSLLIVIAGLVALSAVLGYMLYQERQNTAGFQIKVGPGGIAVEKK